MKKTKLTKTLVLSLLALSSLVACDTGTNTTSSNGFGPIVNSILVEPIETAVVGDTINLKDVVTIDGNTDEFKAELLTTDTATLSGYELKVIKEGEVSVYITAGDREQSLVFTAISRLKDNYKKYTEGIDTNFFLGLVYNNSATGQEYLTGDGWIFNEDYVAYDISYFDNKSEGYEGQLFSGTNVYNFTMDDHQGTNVKLEPGIMSSIYYTNTSFELTYDRFETVMTTTSGYTLLGGDDVARDFCRYLNFNADYFAYLIEAVNQQQGTNFVYKDLSLVVSMHDELSADGLTVTSFPVYSLNFSYLANNVLQTETWDRFYLRSEEMFYTVPGVEELIEKGATPEQIVPTSLFESVNKIAQAKNYTLDIEASWKTSSGAPSSVPTNLVNGWEDIIPNVMFESEQKVYVTENEALFMNLENNSYNRFTEKEGKVYTVSNYTVDADNNAVVGEEGEETETQLTTIWNGNLGLVDSLNTTSAKDRLNVIYQKTEENSDPEENYDYVLGAASTGYEYMGEIIAMAPFYGSGWATFFTSPLFVGLDASGFECMLMNCYVYILEDSLEFEFIFGWDSGHYYHMNFTFNSVGTTTMPTLA